MLQRVCEHIHNYFIREDESVVHPGTFEITGGTLSIDFLKEGQRFWICGSDLNDGVYTWHATGIKNDDDNAAVVLKDETFGGTISAMSVKPDFLALVAEISAWMTKYGDAMNSPYQSENVIGVYSYNKGNGQSGNGAGSDWQTVFRSRLSPYKRVSLL